MKITHSGAVNPPADGISPDRKNDAHRAVCDAVVVVVALAPGPGNVDAGADAVTCVVVVGVARSTTLSPTVRASVHPRTDV